MEKLIITPKTKIFDLLEAYPDLEKHLIAAAPQFKKLQNPILRKTVAKITNLRQAASIGGLNVYELVNLLRKEAGQDHLENFDEGKNTYNINRPAWYDENAITKEVNASEILSKGEEPVYEVLSMAKNLKEGEILMIKAPFLPAPLIDKTISLGLEHWVREVSAEEYQIFLSRR